MLLYAFALGLVLLAGPAAAQEPCRIMIGCGGTGDPNFKGVRSTIDQPITTISGPSDITTRRANLINDAWGITTGVLPTTLPFSVVKDVCSGGTVTTSPCPPAFATGGVGYTQALTNVLRVDTYNYHSNDSSNQQYSSNLYLPNSPNLHRVVFLSGGHQYTCDWTQFHDSAASGSTYRMQEVLQALLSAGYAVFASNMPRPSPCGVPGDHNTMFGSPIFDTAMQYFLEPNVEAMNYWDSATAKADPLTNFTDYNWAGLSGGGWTAIVMAAIDTRVRTSIPVSGGLPGALWNCAGSSPPHCAGDNEAYWDAFYTIAGYSDLMVMGAYGAGRKQVQVVNFQDNCCFGNPQYSAPASQANGGYGMSVTYAPKTFMQYVAWYAAAITAIAPGYSNVVDCGPSGMGQSPTLGDCPFVANGATEHQISAFGQAQIMTALSTGAAPLVGGGGSRRLGR